MNSDTQPQQAASTSTVGERPTRDRILDAAERLFAERGYSGTAVRDIAAAVGLNAASLYNHFAGKEELYEAVLDRGLGPVFALIEEIGNGDDGRFDDRAVLERTVAHFARSPNLACLIHHEALAGGDRLARLAGTWVGPITARGLEAMARRGPDDGLEDYERPLVLAAFVNMILGYFALAPLMETVIGEDPLSRQAVARKSAFLQKILARLTAAD